MTEPRAVITGENDSEQPPLEPTFIRRFLLAFAFGIRSWRLVQANRSETDDDDWGILYVSGNKTINKVTLCLSYPLISTLL